MIFGWGRKNDGFEWHKYVRTTIKLRREDRRKKIEDIKDAAAERVKDAGKAGIGAGRSAATGTAAWLRNVVRALGQWLGRLPHVLGRWTVILARALALALALALTRVSALVLRPLGGWLGRLISAALPSLQRRGVAPILALIALASGASAAARVATIGLDLQAMLALAVAVVMVVLAAAPAMARWSAARPQRRADVDGAGNGWRAVWPRLPARLLAAAGAAVVIIAGGVGLWSLAAEFQWARSLSSVASLSPLMRESISGRARAVAGDTLSVAGKVVRLSGIEAPELGQRCRNSQRRRWRCGTAARSALAKLVARRKVSCTISAEDRDRQVFSGTCMVGKKDLAATLVGRGYAFAIGGLYAPYGGAERTARNAKKGIWSGEAQRPSEYRDQLWDRAKARAPDGCPIKGRVSRRGKVYVLPWEPNYRRVRVRRSRGERWFCSESDAIAAGWKPNRTG